MEQDDKFMLYSEKFNMEAEHVGKYPICSIFLPIFVKRVVLFFNTSPERFLFNGNVRMGSHKVFVIKSDMPDDSKTVGNDAKFEGITEMPVDA